MRINSDIYNRGVITVASEYRRCELLRTLRPTALNYLKPKQIYKNAAHSFPLADTAPRPRDLHTCSAFSSVLHSKGENASLMAATRLDYHIFVFLQDNVRIVIKVEHHDRGEFSWSATSFRCVARADEVHECLHDGVIRRVHIQRK